MKVNSKMIAGRTNCPQYNANSVANADVVFQTTQKNANYHVLATLTRNTLTGGYIKGISFTTTDKTRNGFRINITADEIIVANQYFIDYFVIFD